MSAEADRLLVLITGTGRSGTSTMSGTLHHLGLHVPGPYLGANDSNPKGFYEARWAVRWHKDLTSAAGINEFDSRPGAFARVQDVLTDARRARLRELVATKAEGHDQVVVKDPRSAWVQRAWREEAAAVGLGTRYVTMLRHPAEVVGSRTTYYASDDADRQRSYALFNVARWVNGSLLSEQQTRGEPRAFVRYLDLLEDWRPVVDELAVTLGLRLDTTPGSPGAAAVDEFIDPGLRRHQVTWDDLEIPAELQTLAQEVWDCVDALADRGGVDAEASATLDGLGERYRTLFADATGIAHDAILEARSEARAAGEREGREAAAAASSSAPSSPSGPGAPAAGPEARPVAEVGGRDLLRVLARRARGRLGRRRSDG